MSARPKDIGTKAETAVVRYLIACGIPAERRALAGAADQGDVWAAAGRAVLEVKTRNRAHTPADVERWLAELDRETRAAMTAGARVEVSLLVVKRIGSGPANVGDWHVYCRPGDAAYLLAGVVIADGDGWVQMPLHMAADRLRRLAA